MKPLGKTPPTRRLILALGFVFASLSLSVHAGTASADVTNAIAIYNAAQKTAATQITWPNVSGVQAGYLITIIASSTSTVSYPITFGTNPPQNYDLGVPGDAPAVASYILQNIPTGNIAAAAANIVQKWQPAVSGYANGATIISGTYGQLTAAAAAAVNFERSGDAAGTTALDTAEETVIGDAITKAPTDFQDIIVQSLTTFDPNPVNQASFVALKATAAALGGGNTTLAALVQQIAASDLGSIASSGTFLYTLAVKEPLSASRQAVVQGFTAGDNLAAINTIATAVGTAELNAANLNGGNSTFLGAADVVVGLVTSGSAAGDNIPSVITTAIEDILPGVIKPQNTTGTLSAAYETDFARGALASTFVSDYPGYANTIATAAANELAAPATDAFLLTSDLVANSRVKVATLTGSNSVVGVSEAVADVFTLNDVTNPSSGAIQAKEGAAEGGIEALCATVPAITGSYGGGAGAIAADIANQVLTSSTTNAAKISFATNFISAIDTKNANDPAINATDRAYAAIGLAQDFDTNGIANAAAPIAAAAVESYNTTVLDLNSVAQPILQVFSATSATETESIAAAIAAEPGGYTVGSSTTPYTPAYVAAQLILASRQPGSATALDQAIVGEVTIGVATSSVTTPLGADALITTLANDLGTATGLTALKYVENDLISTGSFGGTFKDTQVISDLTATGGALPSESGTLAAVLAQSNPGDTTAIAYAAAAGTGVTTDALRYVIAQDLVGITPTADIAISGSLGTLIGATTTADKGVFAKDIAAVANAKGHVADIPTIALAVANSISTGDGTLTTDLTYVVNEAISAITLGKTTAEVANAIEAVALNYTGTANTYGVLPGAGALNYSQVAALEGALVNNALYISLAPGTSVVNASIAQEIKVNSYSPVTAVGIAAAFETAIPNSTLAIATVATESSSYTSGSLTAEESGSIAEAIAANLPTGGALISKVPALSGSVALLAADNAAPGAGLTFDDNLATVAGVFGASTAPVTDFVAIAKSLGGAAMAQADQSGADITLAAIGSAFAPGLAAQGGTYTNLKALLAELIALNPNSETGIGYIYGAIYEASGAGSNATLATDLLTAAEADLTAAEISALFPDSTAAKSKADYITALGISASDAGSQDFASINPDETPTLNF